MRIWLVLVISMATSCGRFGLSPFQLDPNDGGVTPPADANDETGADADDDSNAGDGRPGDADDDSNAGDGRPGDADTIDAEADASLCDSDISCHVTGLCYDGVTVCEPFSWCSPMEEADPGSPCVLGSCAVGGVCESSAFSTFFPSDGEDGDQTGLAVAIDGDRAVIGAWYADVDGVRDAGSAVIIERGPGDMWSQVSRLSASDGQAGDVFGSAVALQGTTIMVGARYRELDSVINAGAVYVFELQGDGSWLETDIIAVPGSLEFGSSVTVDGDRAIIGAEYDFTTDVGFGAAYIVERQVDATWTIEAQLTSPRADRLGHSLALSGDRAVVGSLWDTDDYRSLASQCRESRMCPVLESAAMSSISTANPFGNDPFGNNFAKADR